VSASSSAHAAQRAAWERLWALLLADEPASNQAEGVPSDSLPKEETAPARGRLDRKSPSADKESSYD
jgi:hypothetical protein